MRVNQLLYRIPNPRYLHTTYRTFGVPNYTAQDGHPSYYTDTPSAGYERRPTRPTYLQQQPFAADNPPKPYYTQYRYPTPQPPATPYSKQKLNNGYTAQTNKPNNYYGEPYRNAYYPPDPHQTSKDESLRTPPHTHPYESPLPPDLPNIYRVYPSPLCFFDAYAMLMLRPRPALFEALGHQDRYYVKTDGYIEISFLQRLPNSRRYDKSTRRIIRLSAIQLGALLVPYNPMHHQKTLQQTTPNNNSNVTNQTVYSPDNTWVLTVGPTPPDSPEDLTPSITFRLYTNGGAQPPTAPEGSPPINVDDTQPSKPPSLETPTYTVSLPYTEYLALQAFVSSTLPTLLGWHIINNPPLVLHYLKNVDSQQS